MHFPIHLDWEKWSVGFVLMVALEISELKLSSLITIYTTTYAHQSFANAASYFEVW